MNVLLQMGVNRMFLIGTKHRSQTSVVKNRPATPCCHLQCVPRGQKIISNIVFHSQPLKQLQILSCTLGLLPVQKTQSQHWKENFTRKLKFGIIYSHSCRSTPYAVIFVEHKSRFFQMHNDHVCQGLKIINS